MKIVDIKPYVVWAGMRNICLVKIETDCGVHGWGESGLSSRELAVVGAINHFKSFLVGKSALNISALWQEMYRSQYFEGGRVLSAAISAIDIALYDCLGKALNVPVWQLLGGAQRQRIPLFATSILPYNDALTQDVLRLKDEGWDCIRLTTGEHGTPQHETVFNTRKSISTVAGYINEIRQTIGTQTSLGVDYHHRLSVVETISFLNRVNEGALDFLEEPIRAQSPQAYKSIQLNCKTPFAIGEEFTSKWDFKPFLDAGVIGFARIDICNAGGFTEGMKIAAFCETQYIDMMPHNPLSPLCTAASIHYCAAFNNLSWLEVLDYGDSKADYSRIFDKLPSIHNQHFDLIQTPGLGIDVNEEYLKTCEFSPWEPPRLVRGDGSYQNW